MVRKTKAKKEVAATNPPIPPHPEPNPTPTPETKETIFGPEGELVVDVFETNSDFVVLTAIAGAQIKEIDISVEKDMMVIKGKRPDPHDNPEKKYFYQECYWGPFSRKIVLPENIDTQAAKAQMDKGLLMIKIPKITKSQDKPNLEVS